jgi:hypothetical protein
MEVDVRSPLKAEVSRKQVWSFPAKAVLLDYETSKQGETRGSFKSVLLQQVFGDSIQNRLETAKFDRKETAKFDWKEKRQSLEVKKSKKQFLEFEKLDSEHDVLNEGGA